MRWPVWPSEARDASMTEKAEDVRGEQVAEAVRGDVPEAGWFGLAARSAGRGGNPGWMLVTYVLMYIANMAGGGSWA
jgi:hypothetical protein